MTTTDPAVDEGKPAARKKRGNNGVGLAAMEAAQLILIIFDNHEEGLPNDSRGRDLLYPVIACARHLRGENRARMFADIRRVAPWATEEQIAELERKAIANAQWYLPAELGEMYGVTKEQRHRLRTWQLAAIDETAEELKEAEAKAGRERARRSRQKKRAERPAKPSAADRRARLLEELPVNGDWVEFATLVNQVRHLKEFQSAKDVKGVAHKDADRLKADGLLVDKPQLQGRKPSRWVRRARDSDRLGEAPRGGTLASPPSRHKATRPATARRDYVAEMLGGVAAPPRPATASGIDRGKLYIGSVRRMLAKVPPGRGGLEFVMAWIKSPEESEKRDLARLTEEQRREVFAMVISCLGEG